jgi:hypothetical protein
MTVLRHEGVYTDRDVRANEPGTIIKNKKETTYILIDVAIQADRNDMQKEEERIVKY